MDLKECFFCGETNEIVLEEHHLVPKSAEITPSGETIVLCANCHRKLHYILNPLLSYIKIEKVEQLPEPVIDEATRLKIERKRKLRRQILLAIKKYEMVNEYRQTPKKELFLHITDFSREEIAKAVGDLLEEGVIFEPREGFLKIT